VRDTKRCQEGRCQMIRVTRLTTMGSEDKGVY
jgi:hypothetical protein